MKTFTQSMTLVALWLTLMSCSQSVGTTYYFDAKNGNDLNYGTSEKKAFATLEKANDIVLQSGDKLLFKAGTKYQGQLKPKGEGTAQYPVIISKYGGDEKPIIEGEGKFTATVHIYNMKYVEVRDLEITNTGDTAKTRRRGVIVEAENYGIAKHIILDNLYIHDVNGSLVKKDGGGSAILWQNHGKEVKTKFDSLIIENCHLARCERNGMNSRGYTRRDEWYPSTNVIVRNNLLEHIPGDGIVPIGTDGAIIEHNVMRDCPDILSHKEAAAGIWPWSADNTIIQFNEVSGHKAKWDGQGFDSDWNCQNTTIQYNYSHDNYGGFLLVCNNGSNIGSKGNIGTTNTIVRYNLSINDGIRPYPTTQRGKFSPTMHISGPNKGTYIYNNIFIIPQKAAKDIDRTFVRMDNWGGPWSDKTLFYNNYFDLSEKSTFFYGKSKNNFAQENSFSTKKLKMTESNEDLPEWTKEVLNNMDKEFADKLIEKFLKEDATTSKKIKEMVNNTSFNY
jgi:hypothetical protein